MDQFYKEYYYWEDYINGMYEFPNQKDINTHVNNALKVLRDNNLFLDTCKSVVEKWVISTKVNLTNRQCNRKAWLGQASCSYKYKVPEICTRIAWSRLSVKEQTEANEIAEKIIINFELNYDNKNIELYK